MNFYSHHQLSSINCPNRQQNLLSNTKSKTPFLLLYLATFTRTERLAFISFLEYLLVAYCRWTEQSWGSGRWGTRPPDRRTKGPAELWLSERAWDKRLRRRALYGPVLGKSRQSRGLCPRTKPPGLGEPPEHNHVWSIITPSKQWTPRLPQRKDGCPLADCPKTWKERHRNKGTGSVGREPLKRSQEHGFTLLQGKTMQLTGVKRRQTRGQGKTKDMDGFECRRGWGAERMGRHSEEANRFLRGAQILVSYISSCLVFWRRNNGTLRSKHSNVELVSNYRQKCCQLNLSVCNDAWHATTLKVI